MSVPRLRLVHETNPEKYFPALSWLASQGYVVMAGAHRYSVGKEWLRAWLRERKPLSRRTMDAVGDLRFRLMLRLVKEEVIVIGFAPWDWRILLYRGLAQRNRILYQTSWHDWGLERVPRQPGPPVLRRWLRREWLAFLERPSVSVIAVTPAAAEAVTAATHQVARVIPHAVPEEFFDVGGARVRPATSSLRLLFVGEVARKKGVELLLDLMRDLGRCGSTLTFVGNGAMEDAVAHAGGAITFLGPVRDRVHLARIMSEHDVLVLPSMRTGKWEELFGIVIVEALAAGLAVLASDHVGPRSVLAPVNGAGLLPEGDLTAWRNAIQALVEDASRLERLRILQRQVAANYRIGAVAKLWLEEITR